MRDEENWLIWGTYAISMFSAVLANAFSKNSQAKYIEKPIYEQVKNNIQITEEEKQKQIEQLFMQLQIMETNFKANHKDGSE